MRKTIKTLIVSKKSKKPEMGDVMVRYKNGKVKVFNSQADMKKRFVIGCCGNIHKDGIKIITSNIRRKATGVLKLRCLT